MAAASAEDKELCSGRGGQADAEHCSSPSKARPQQTASETAGEAPLQPLCCHLPHVLMHVLVLYLVRQ